MSSPRSPISPMSSPNDDRNSVGLPSVVSSPSMNALQLTGSGKPKKFACQQCGRAFSTSGHLARHIRIHTGERNHKCPFPGCETRCSRQDNLQQHYRIHLSPGSRRSAARDAAGRRRRRGSSAASNSSLEMAMHSPGAGNDQLIPKLEPPNTPPPLELGRPRDRFHLPHPQVVDRHPFSDQVYYHHGAYAPSRRGAYGFADSEVSLSPLPSLGMNSSGVDDVSVSQRIPSIYAAGGHSHLHGSGAYGLHTNPLDAHNHPHTSHTPQSLFSSSCSRSEGSQILGYPQPGLHSPPLSSDSGLSTPEFPTTPHSATSSLLSEGEVMRRGTVDYLPSSFSGDGSTSGHNESSIANGFSTPGPYGASQSRPADVALISTSSMVEHHRSTRTVDAVYGSPSCRPLTQVTPYSRKNQEFEDSFYDTFSAGSGPFPNLY
ncbi:hypothetical protein QCA50_014902 [Cerrena zonata]|uniref:C2H2-type domain-containing protein n=1 Tax=Cerrena zonata TaxID=2478898 RepID=A0AAW0FYS7_9APHY